MSVTTTRDQQAKQQAPGKRSPAAWALTQAIRGYRVVVSPLLPPSCRFYPSCSAYALEAVQVHGALRGAWLAVRRLSRCHPFHAGGLDPVPPRAGRPADPEFSDQSARELAGG